MEDSKCIDFYSETVKKPLEGFNQKRSLIQSVFSNDKSVYCVERR